MTTKLALKALEEPLRDLGRTVVLAVIPVVIDSLGKNGIDWKTIAIVGIIAGLRFIEKFLYESGKLKKDINVVSELLQFK